MSVREGMTLGPYRVMERIGRGGMATVYRAYHPGLDRNVAIKVLPDFFAEDATFGFEIRQCLAAAVAGDHRLVSG